MARFSFPVPGRKKTQPAPTINQEPSNKAYRFLGSTPLSIDAPGPKSWDHVSNSGISVTVTDAQSPITRPYEQRHQVGVRGPDTDWGDESEILPQRLRSRYLDPNGDAGSDGTTALRSRTSSSTIKSWYDKSKQPLAVSQQTSASAMARGLPSKAQRMLDMDNSLAPQKTKKKPAKLDLSSLTSNSRNRVHGSDGSILGPDMVTKSPSIVSPLSPTSSGDRRRLKKRPTKESLRQRPSISEPMRPSTAGSGRFLNHPNGVPDLYGHYEQMSLRQIMDLEPHDQDATDHNANGPIPRVTPNPSIIRTSPTRRTNHAHTSSYSTHSSKPIQHSPSASISSRHTRTSKASKRTETSFQDADLQGKSVLSLSSDSEDDESYGDGPARSPASVFARRPSDFEEHAASLDNWQASNSSLSQSPSDGRSRNGKRTSFAPFHTYLPVPGETPKPALGQVGSSSSGPLLPQAPPTRVSSVSNSSASSAVTWQSNKPGYGVQEARAITMQAAQGPTDQESPMESGSEWDQPPPQSHSSGARDSVGSTNDQPTPPLSPSSVDFYIRSAHSSIDGPSGGQNRFMAVSKQEELLLAALRQKRQLMRESFIAEEVSARLGRHSRKSSKGHQAKTSTATITQDLFNFDFPAPPKPKDDNSMSSSDSPGYQPETQWSRMNDRGTSEEESIGAILSPAPRRTSDKLLRGRLDQVETPLDQPEQQDDEWPISPRTLLPFLEQNQDAAPDGDARSIRSYDSSIEDHEPILLPRRYSGGLGRRKSSQVLPGRGHRSRPSVVPEEPASPPPSGNMQFDHEDAGVPRPDSPISPDAFPAIPTERVTVNKKLARLSAVGTAPLGSQPGWWKDDE